MIGAVSSSSTASTLLGASASTSSSSSSESATDIQAKIDAKKAELAEAKDDASKQSLQGEIEALEAQLAKLETGKSGSQQAPAGGGRLSGENDRIGSGNVSEDAEFGERFLYV